MICQNGRTLISKLKGLTECPAHERKKSQARYKEKAVEAPWDETMEGAENQNCIRLIQIRRYGQAQWLTPLIPAL